MVIIYDLVLNFNFEKPCISLLCFRELMYTSEMDLVSFNQNLDWLVVVSDKETTS